MNVSQAIAKRCSIRAFIDTPVERALIERILSNSASAPSGGNVQPWQVHVATGGPLQEFIADIEKKFRAGKIEAAEFESYPKGLWSPHREYRFENGEALYEILGLKREDKIGRMNQFSNNFRFFGAPVALFFTMDKRFAQAQWSDVGMFMQNLMLLATEAGLGTCAQRCWLMFKDSIAEFLGLDGNSIVLCGLALGYPDESAPINKLKTDRAKIEDYTTFIGFE
jgi:nitroreductase